MKRIFLFLVLILCLQGCSSTQLKKLEPSNFFSPYSPEDFLTDQKYKSMTIEVISVEKTQPSSGDFDYVVENLKTFCKKPGGIRYTLDDPIPADLVSTSKWSDEDIVSFEQKTARLESSGSNLVVHVIFIPGVSSQDTSEVITDAIAFGNHSAVFFYDLFRSQDGISRLTILHEFGHFCGLVNRGTPQQTNHQSIDHPTHCRNSQCIMFWRSNQGQTGLDSDCMYDLMHFSD